MHKTKIRFCIVNSENLILFETVPKFQLYNIFSTILFLHLDMFQLLCPYEINLNLGYACVDDMLKFSGK